MSVMEYNVFALAELAAGYECVGRIRLFGLEFVLEVCDLGGNGNWFSAPNASALQSLSLTEEMGRGGWSIPPCWS